VIVCAECGEERTAGPFCLHCGGVETKTGSAPSPDAAIPKPFVSSMRTTSMPPAAGPSITPRISLTKATEGSTIPPGASPPELPPLTPPSRHGPNRGAVIAGIVALILIAGTAIAKNANNTNVTPSSQLSARPSTLRTGTSLATPEATATPTSVPTTPPPINPQVRALARLRSIHAKDLAATSFTGQWVAQLASKIPGITDPLQTTASGSHTFAIADILAEYQRARNNPDFGNYVLLLKSTDYGRRQLYHSQPLWVTVAALPWFSSEQDVTDWCAQEFPQLSPSVLLDSCTARKLNPPSNRR
jgi:hypothetical protein